MKITDAEVIVTSPGRNYVILKLTTSDGHQGWGDATLNGRELAVASYLSDHVLPLLAGRDARRITDTWQYLYRGAYWRRGPVTMAAISAVDQALWDIKGKAAGLPVYELLGGRARDGITVYGHASGSGIEETVADVQRFLDRGHRAVRVQSSIPGLEATYGIGVDDGHIYEPAAGARPTEEAWDSAAYLDFLPQLVKRIREELGYGFHLLHDVHHRLTPIEAARLGQSLEPYRMFWLEDATPAEDQAAFRLIRSHTTTPLAVGEVFNSIWDCQQLISERLIDYIRTSVTHAGGITHVRRIFDLADLYGVRTGAHGPGDISPIGMAANLHLDLAVPNFGIQEYMGHREPATRVFDPGYRYTDGMLQLSDRPGLGVEVDENAALQYPYEAKYLPVTRLRDGGVHDW
jgi:mannonate dehydratase